MLCLPPSLASLSPSLLSPRARENREIPLDLDLKRETRRSSSLREREKVFDDETERRRRNRTSDEAEIGTA